MPRPTTARAFYWGPALLISGAVLALVGALVRVPAPPPIAAMAPAAVPLSVRPLAALPEDGLERARLTLQDPTPLFLPAVAAGGLGPVVVRTLPGAPATARRRDDYPARLDFTDTNLLARLPRPAAPSSSGEALAALQEPRALAGWRRTGGIGPPAVAVAAGPRTGRVEFTPVAGGATVTLNLRPEETPVEASWRPARLLLVCDAAGLVGRPALLASAGTAELDDFLVERVARIARSRASLRPGSYQVAVGP
jgi:hypothetical protein